MQVVSLVKVAIKRVVVYGVGASVVNALSEWLVVTIKRDGNIYEQRFENGGVPATTLEKIGKTKESGTTMHFKPDTTILVRQITIMKHYVRDYVNLHSY